MLAGHASRCWRSALGAGVNYNREKNESLACNPPHRTKTSMLLVLWNINSEHAQNMNTSFSLILLLCSAWDFLQMSNFIAQNWTNIIKLIQIKCLLFGSSQNRE